MPVPEIVIHLHRETMDSIYTFGENTHLEMVIEHPIRHLAQKR